MNSIRLMTTEDNVIKNISLAGLAILPLIIYLDFQPFISGPVENVQTVKTLVSSIICCILVAYSLYSKGIPKNNSKALSVLMFYLSIHWIIAPQYNIKVLGENVAGLWIFRDFHDIILYYLMIMAISSVDWCKDSLKSLYNIICIVSSLCIAYLFVQYFDIDQFQNVIDNPYIKAQTNPHLTSFLGQSTFAGTFIAMTIPFFICNRKILWVILASVAVYLTGSMTAYVMTGFIFLIYLLFRCGRILRWVTILSTSVVSGVVLHNDALWKNTTSLVMNSGSGRYKIWAETFMNTINCPFPEINTVALTGYGLGSYEFILRNFSNSHFVDLHNEYLELFCTAGLIGLVLLLFSLFYLIKKIFKSKIIDRYRFAAICCFLSVCFGNLIHFMWQLDPHRFYISVMLGIIINFINKEK